MNSPREQFSLIYDQYIEKIYRFVYLRVNTQEVAEDITSKVFTKAWASYQKDQDIKNIGAFLYQIARNNIVDFYKEKGKNPTVSPDMVAQLVDTKADIHEKAIFTANIGKVKEAMGKLKQHYQDILTWYYVEDMSAEHIAQLMGKPVGTVRVMIHRGIQSLKDELIEEA
jgi:RNA polymerase sigma factor (sigma-70 family)